MESTVNWDAEAEDYQRVFREAGWNDYSRKLMNFFVQELGLRAGDRVIDIGCGVGKYGTMFAAMGCDVTLNDISPEMLRHARENLSRFGGKCTFICGDFDKLSPAEPALEKKFSLSISTMSPAVHDRDGLEKMSGMTDGFCFLSQFYDWQQPARDEFYSLSGMKPGHVMNVERMRQRIEESMAELRELGCEPLMRLEDYCWCDMRSPEEAARRFARDDDSPDSYERALESVKKLCGPDGLFADAVNTKAAWIYWRSPGKEVL